jgi:hypothetical protein
MLVNAESGRATGAGDPSERGESQAAKDTLGPSPSANLAGTSRGVTDSGSAESALRENDHRRLVVFTEFKIRQRFSAIWSSSCSPVGKAKAFLRLAKKTRRSALAMVEQGFTALHKGQNDQASRFWTHSARLLTLSDRARNLAKSALRERGSSLSFDGAPRTYAPKTWDWDRKGGEKTPAGAR